MTKLEERLYTMEYVGDYGLNEYLEQGGGANVDELSAYLTQFLSGGFYTVEATDENPYGCSTISAKTTNGDIVFGRNYDWEKCTAMIVHTKPADGYESISTACIDFLGFGENWVPEGMGNQIMSLSAIYVPLDGMNEKGLVIADLVAGDNEETHQVTDKADITTTVGIRLILDYAATVDEAIALLSSYDMNSDIGTAHHYAISDASGKSVVVEFVNNEMIVTETNVVTNFYLSDCEKQGTGSEQAHDRYTDLTNIWDEKKGILSEDEIRDALQLVSQGNYDSEYEVTQWSVVYNQSKLSLDYYWEEDFVKRYEFNLYEDLF